jgi:NitT/TauT family transport system ATP-binding protein
MISINGAAIEYSTRAGVHPALEPVDLSIPRGSSCVIIGPTGCGKTSLLSMLAGLAQPTSGSIHIDGTKISAPRISTSLILQHHGLFPWKTAGANVELGLTLRGAPPLQKKETCTRLMDELGILDVQGSYPAQLSGGQRQRVAIARALATLPDLLLMDEPFSALDTMTRENLQNQIVDLWQKHGFTSVLVTHSIEEAVFLGQKILVLSSRPGRVLGTVENPKAGSPGLRLTETFHHKCVELRTLLEGSS